MFNKFFGEVSLGAGFPFLLFKLMELEKKK